MGIDQIVVADDAIDALLDEVRVRAGGERALLLVDRTPTRRGSDDLKPLIEEGLARAATLSVRRLPADAAGTFHADIETARRLAHELDDFTVVLSVGSGSVTDVVKCARHLFLQKTGGKLPLISVPTVASATAYTSALAVLTVDGVKWTPPGLPPDAAIGDLLTEAGWWDETRADELLDKPV